MWKQNEPLYKSIKQNQRIKPNTNKICRYGKLNYFNITRSNSFKLNYAIYNKEF